MSEIISSVILVTGSSKGIGKHLAEYYIKENCTVIGCSRGSASIFSENYRHFAIDISDENLVLEMFKTIRKEYGRLDVLINNAGLSSKSFVLMISKLEAVKLFDVNVIGPMLVSKEAVKLMKKRNYGRIINISSIHVSLSSVGTSLYGSSKAAFEQFAFVLAREVREYGITVNTIGLSVVEDSGMIKDLSLASINSILNSTISKKFVPIGSVISAVNLFLHDEYSTFTGQNLLLGS